MLIKNITYTDFNGDTQTEAFHFNLSKAELAELELSFEGGLEAHLKTVAENKNQREIVETFKMLILSSYGKRSADGKRFIKNQEIRDEFASSEAYSELFVELATSETAAPEFMRGILPSTLQPGQNVVELSQANNAEPSVEDILATMPAEDEPAPKKTISKRQAQFLKSKLSPSQFEARMAEYEIVD